MPEHSPISWLLRDLLRNVKVCAVERKNSSVKKRETKKKKIKIRRLVGPLIRIMLRERGGDHCTHSVPGKELNSRATTAY